jgi:hypothetical protein
MDASGPPSGGSDTGFNQMLPAPYVISWTRRLTTSFAPASSEGGLDTTPACAALVHRATAAGFLATLLVVVEQGCAPAGLAAELRLTGPACLLDSLEGKEPPHIRPQVPFDD